jgi:hypothetical protein
MKEKRNTMIEYIYMSQMERYLASVERYQDAYNASRQQEERIKPVTLVFNARPMTQGMPKSCRPISRPTARRKTLRVGTPHPCGWINVAKQSSAGQWWDETHPTRIKE